MTVRTRIAPSPTGDPHVGTAFIALFNYCFAKQHGGQFLLRIEDTDQVRSTLESEDAILEALRWTGLEWDEGPDVGGSCGPYRQSERSDIYTSHAATLVRDGNAFPCFCDEHRLKAVRDLQTAAGAFLGYDGHCLTLATEEVQAKLDSGEPHVVRMVVPREGVCTIRDRLRGDIAVDWSTVDMQVLVKSDGLPTYHLANVVDDHLMGITHVIRGEEWISSAPKHILLYQYFGWETPQFIHMPLLRNPDKSKLSKRKNPTSILYYKRMGFLSEALLNYLGQMGWSMPDGREKFTLAEMVEAFDIDRISLGGPVFDLAKLEWLNGRYIREDHTPEQLAGRLMEWAFNQAHLTQVAELAQPRVNKLADFMPMAGFFFEGVVPLTGAQIKIKGLDSGATLRALQFTLWRLEAERTWTKEALEALLREMAERLGLKLRDLIAPLFVAMSGRSSATPLFDTMAILGADLTRARLRAALGALGGVSGKAAKKLEKEYRELMAAPNVDAEG
jgi:glutamyl-tRNA synthetase